MQSYSPNDKCFQTVAGEVEVFNYELLVCFSGTLGKDSAHPMYRLKTNFTFYHAFRIAYHGDTGSVKSSTESVEGDILGFREISTMHVKM